MNKFTVDEVPDVCGCDIDSRNDIYKFVNSKRKYRQVHIDGLRVINISYYHHGALSPTNVKVMHQHTDAQRL